MRHLRLVQTVIFSSVMSVLAGCGDGSSDPSPTTPPGTEIPHPGNPGGDGNTEKPDSGLGEKQYPEPTSDKYTQLNALGFYDQDKTGQTRPVRNDLGGSLPAMVQFAQSHTVDPSGNAAHNMPTLTAEREALLLVTPDPGLSEAEMLTVSASLNGQSLGSLPMRHPNAIFRSDSNNNDGRPDYVYSRRAWSAVLPWDWVKPGLELRVSDSKNRSGTLAASAIEFAAPAELVLHSFALGMLTEPPSSPTHYFLHQPAKAATDYFQTVPLARLTAAYYEPVRLNKVMVASGVIYDTVSATMGDLYSGDMRENTAKSTFSTGINLANFGVTSSDMQSQNQPQLFQSVVAHHARGKYSNGDKDHGLSGGNGMLTLHDSVGNEFSHEIGHHYGLGHYPGEAAGNYFWAGHHHDSGWGFIGYRKRMRANLNWTANKNAGMQGMPVFADSYSFGQDAMSGGYPTSALSRYTYYTGYSTSFKIQPKLDKPVLTPSSPTGYSQWNASTQAMEVIAPSIPASQNTVWYNSASGKFLAPRLQGVPVITLLGGYDPVTDKTLIYPALRSNWGNVFTLPEKDVNTSETRQCWLDVDFAQRPSQRIAVAGMRMQIGSVNKLHVNLAQSEQPTQAKLYCQTGADPARELYHLDIEQGLPAMPAPVIVGKQAGYSAIRQVELPELETGLLSLANKKLLALSSAEQILYDSYADNSQELSAAARQQFDRYNAQQKQAERLNRWIGAYASDLDNAGAQKALLDFIAKLGLNTQALIPAAQTMRMGNGNCIQKAGTEVRIAGPSLCTADANEQWILDGRGSIRSRADLSLCLTAQDNGGAVKLMACDLRNDNQVWDTSVPKRIARGNRCLDLNSGYLTNNLGSLITYPCLGGANQQWNGLQQGDSLVMSLLDSRYVRYLNSLAQLQTAAKQGLH